MRFVSLFSGIEAASVAWTRLGWTPLAFAEIEAFPRAVLKHYHPEVPNLGDVSSITEDDIRGLGHVDLIIGGFPCQDVSVAGRRKGLKHADGSQTRSGLFFEAMRLVRYAREHCGLRWLVIENVPGLYSSHGGRDFATVVGEMVGCGFDVPPDGWRNCGAATGPRGLCEWATLDAQFWGLAQRRQRVFLVADFGDWRGRSPLLLERASLSGHPAPSREAGEGFAKPITPGSPSSSGYRNDADTADNLIHCPPIVPQAMSRKWSKGSSGPAGDEVANLIAHSLRAEGFDASEDGTGRGTPIVPVAFDGRQDLIHGEVAGPVDTNAFSSCVAFTAKDHGADAEADLSPTLRAGGFDKSHANGGVMPAVAFALRGREGGTMPEVHDQVSALRSASGGSTRDYVATVAGTLKSCGGQSGTPNGAEEADRPIGCQSAVRRLTPVECEKLQGFPPGYTLIPFRGKPAADGPRYKSLGNSFPVPVVRWIGERIEMVERLTAADE